MEHVSVPQCMPWPTMANATEHGFSANLQLRKSAFWSPCGCIYRPATRRGQHLYCCARNLVQHIGNWTTASASTTATEYIDTFRDWVKHAPIDFNEDGFHSSFASRQVVAWYFRIWCVRVSFTHTIFLIPLRRRLLQIIANGNRRCMGRVWVCISAALRHQHWPCICDRETSAAAP